MAHYSGSNSCAVFTNLKPSNAAFSHIQTVQKEKKNTFSKGKWHRLNRYKEHCTGSIASCHFPSLSLYFSMLIINAKIFSRLIGIVENTELFQMKQSQWCSAELLSPTIFAALSLAPCAKVPLSVPNVCAQKTDGRDVNGVLAASWGASYSCEAARLFLPLFLVDFSSRSKENKIPRPESQVPLPSLPHTVKRASTAHTPAPPHPHRPTPAPASRAATALPTLLYSPKRCGGGEVEQGEEGTLLGVHSALFSLSVDNPLWTCQPTQEY